MWNNLLSMIMAAALACGTTALSGCASSTTISSNPEGANLTIDGQPVGQTPVTFVKSAVWTWTSHRVKLERQGYQTRTGFVNAEMSPVHLAFGILCFVPLFPLVFVGQYKPRYHFEMQPSSGLKAQPTFRESITIDFRG